MVGRKIFPADIQSDEENQLRTHLNRCDETPLKVIHDDRPAGSKSYMWVHLTGELSPVPRIIVYEYQKTRHSDHLKEYYKNFRGSPMTDGLEHSPKERLKERQTSIRPLVEENFA